MLKSERQENPKEDNSLAQLYAVIDTNVLVSSFLTSNEKSATRFVFNAILDGTLIPLFHEDIMNEYRTVLCREKFHFDQTNVEAILAFIELVGFNINPESSGEFFSDEDDRIFYEVALSKQDYQAKLVTGNVKHYPRRNFVVTPAEMVEIIQANA